MIMHNRVISGLFAVLAIISSVLAVPERPAAAYAGAPRFAPGSVYTQNFPDPSILEVDGVYHAYSTSTGGAGLPHMVSTDLITWTAVGDALGQGPIWSPHPGFASEIWAPSVLRLDNGTFAAVYAAPTGEGDRHCLSIAYASSADGPFRDETTSPPLCESDPNGALDPYLVRDGTGNIWVIWKNEGVPANWSDLTPRPTGFWSRQLTNDAKSWAPGSTVHHIFDISPAVRPWQGSVIENPAMIFWEGSWILTYSANSWDSAEYAIGWARCDGPGGPCSEPGVAPLAASDARRLGPGGQTPVIGPDGSLRLGYHAWNPPFTSYPAYPACDTNHDGTCADQGQRRLWVEGLCIAGNRAFLHPSDGRRFCDVAPDSWYATAVDWLAGSGITTGITPTAYGSADGVTRSQMVTFLWRYSGRPVPAANGVVFDDVDPGSYYAVAADWAGNAGITTGVGPGVFGPEGPVSRAQMATFLWRLAGNPAPAVGGPVFDDVDPCSWYSTAVMWLAGEGITNGVAPGLYGPDEVVTRAQMAAFLHRYDNRP